MAQDQLRKPQRSGDVFVAAVEIEVGQREELLLQGNGFCDQLLSCDQPKGEVAVARLLTVTRTMPTLAEVAANFKTPPREYGAIHWSTWGGEINHQRIVQEFDQLVVNGIYVINFGPGQRINPKYLSPEHIALTKDYVEEAKKRGMKV